MSYSEYYIYADALTNDRKELSAFLKDPDYYLFLNRFCFTRELTQKYKAEIEQAIKRKGITQI